MAKRRFTDEERRLRHNAATAASRARVVQTPEQRELLLAKRKAYRDKTKAARAEYQRKYVAANSQVLAEKKRVKRENPDYQARERAAYRRWFESNRDIDSAKQHRRRAHYIQAIPKWFSELDELIMLEAADLCRMRAQVTGIGWQVDHIVPLVSKRVCGLHIGCNIAVIPAKLNQAKGNRYWPDMP